jgi:arginyl-tRNA synthetase
VVLSEPTELALARQMIKLTEQLLKLEGDLYPHALCEYIFELSTRFNQFYEACPVVNAPTPEQVKSRLALCTLTANILRLCLDLLGIQVVEKI